MRKLINETHWIGEERYKLQPDDDEERSDFTMSQPRTAINNCNLYNVLIWFIFNLSQINDGDVVEDSKSGFRGVVGSNRKQKKDKRINFKTHIIQNFVSHVNLINARNPLKNYLP